MFFFFALFQQTGIGKKVFVLVLLCLPAFVEVEALEISRLKPSRQLTRQEHDGQRHRQVKERVTVRRLKMKRRLMLSLSRLL